MSSRRVTVLLALACVGLPVGGTAQPPTSSPDTTARRVLLISVDGLGDDVLDRRDELGLEIPILRELMRRGTTAEALRTVLPSATFPVHVSMVTGVSPARHGIQANSRFVPEPEEDHPHTFASEVRVPTLFDRVAGDGLTSAAVWWPLTAGGPSQLNLPDVSGTSDTTIARHLFHLLRGPTEEVFPDATALVDVTDEERTEVALRFLRERPHFAAVHLTAVDAARHGAPDAWNEEAAAALEATDVRIGRLLAGLEESGSADETVVMITSDHGLTPIRHAVIPNALLRTLGLIDVDERGRVEAWGAMTYSAVGSAGIYLHPGATAIDTATVERALDILAGHPEHGLQRLLRGGAVGGAGAFPGAYAVLTAEPDFVIVGVGVTGDIDRSRLLLEPRPQGQHGHDPRLRAMEAVLIAAGPGIEEGVGAPRASLLDLAPTIARVLGVEGFDGPGRALPAFGATETP